MYVGSENSEFAAHREDGDLCSINYLHCGASKFWYFVIPENAGKFEELCLQFADRLNEQCPTYVRHKWTIISPKTLKEHKIRFVKVIDSYISFNFLRHPNRKLVEMLITLITLNNSYLVFSAIHLRSSKMLVNM